jgi:hypothetical protein
MRVEVTVTCLALFETLLEVLVAFAVGLRRGPSVLYLLDDEIGGKVLYFLHHVQLLHQDVSVLLTSRHLEVLQHHEGHKRVERDTGDKDADDDDARHPHDVVLPIADRGQGGNYHLEAVDERDVGRNHEEAVRVEDHDAEIDNYHVCYAFLVQDHLAGELECQTRLNPVQVSDASSLWVVVHAAPD